MRVDVKGEGQPLGHAEVVLLLKTWGHIRRMLAGEIDENGHIAFFVYGLTTTSSIASSLRPAGSKALI